MAPGGGSAATRDILRPVLPALFRLDADLRPQPDLVQTWPTADDFTFDPFSVTLRLRDASWSDDRKITSKDVAFSAEKLKAGPTGYRYRFLRSVSAPDARTVRLHFDRVVRRWWALFSIDDMVLPAHAYDDKWNRGPSISGGPFFVERWVDGLEVRLRRNDRYWGGTVPLAGIEVKFVPDDETRFQLLDRGELDAFFAEGEVNIGRRARARGIELVAGEALSGSEAASGVFGPTWWELDLDPERLREPVAKAIVEATHPTLAAEILEDSGRPMNGIPPEFTGGERASAEPWRGRGSLQIAKGLLDRGGIPQGQDRAEFQLAYPSAPTAGAIAAYIHFRLREIGLTAELVGTEPDSFERTWVAQRRAPVMLRLRRGSDAPDAASYASSSLLPGAGPADDQVTAAQIEVTQERAASDRITGLAGEPWADAQRALVGAGTTAPLVRARTWIVGSRGVAGPHATGAAHGPLWNAVEWTKTNR